MGWEEEVGLGECVTRQNRRVGCCLVLQHCNAIRLEYNLVAGTAPQTAVARTDIEQMLVLVNQACNSIAERNELAGSVLPLVEQLPGIWIVLHQGFECCFLDRRGPTRFMVECIQLKT